MATQVIKSVGATGRDYATWQLACAAIPLDLVAADQNWIFECYNDAEFDFQVNAAYLSSGTGSARTIVADATRTVTFRPAAGQGIRDHANKGTNPIRYDQSKGVGVVVGQGGGGSNGLFVDIPYAMIDGIQFRAGADTNYLIWATATGSVVKNCIVKCVGNGQWAVKMHGGASLVNSVIHIVGSTQWGGIAFSGPASVIGCTVFGELNQHAFFNNYGGGAGITIKHCVATGFSSFLRDYNASTGAGMWSGGTYSHNASDTTIPVGTNNVESFTAANQFVNIASPATLDLRPKAGNSLQAGVTDALMGGVDLLGTTRAGTPTIGAVEYVAGDPNGSASGAPASITITAPAATATGTTAGSGSASGAPAALSLSAPTATASGTSSGGGTITTPPMKNNTGTVLASISGWSVNVYHTTTGALIIQKTGLTSSAGGVLTITDAAIASGSTYAYEPFHATYGRRLPTSSAA